MTELEEFCTAKNTLCDYCEQVECKKCLVKELYEEMLGQNAE